MSRQQRTMNIGGDPNDTSYRYKMALLQTKIEGRGNGIKTILLNITTVSEHLRTEPSYTTKFFGIEFAAQSNFDKQRMVGIVNGKHQKQDLQSKLNKYVNEFILCKKCKLPELKWRIIKKKQLLQKCKACSWSGPNTSNHRVRAYIINHPPKTKKTQNKPSNKKPKIKENKDISSEEKEVEWRDDEVWSVDTSLDAIAQQRHDEMRRLAQKNDVNVGINTEEKKESRSAAKTLRNYVDCQERSYLEILDEIKRISLAHNCDQKKKIQITIDALCKLDTLDGFIKSLRRYKVIFSTFASNEDDAKIFFGVLEEFICRRNPDEFLGKVYKILECLYDEEIVSEDDILLWMDLPTDKAIIVDQDEAEVIRNKAAPFIKWLRENEEDGEDMEDAEDDMEEEGEEEDIC